MRHLTSKGLHAGHFSARAAVRPSLKRAMDMAGAAALLLCTAPLLLLLSALIAADGGPVFTAHRRVGRGGREFGCLKFRTARPDAGRGADAHAERAATGEPRSDLRLTPFGRALRAANLDEVPQLLNVLRGDMSLVGPRPVPREELDGFYAPAGAVEAYLSVRPGVTGPWQVGSRGADAYAECIVLDAAYARSLSLRADLAILARTAGAVLRRRAAV